MPNSDGKAIKISKQVAALYWDQVLIHFPFPQTHLHAWSWMICMHISRQLFAKITNRILSASQCVQITWLHLILRCEKSFQEKNIWVLTLKRQHSGQLSDKKCPNKASLKAGLQEERYPYDNPNSFQLIEVKKHSHHSWEIKPNHHKK